MTETAVAEKPQTEAPPKLGIFTLAQNLQAYLKAGIMGFAGSGKTFTASLIAKGLVETYGLKKPVFLIDTETGSDFMVPKFKEWGIQLYSARTRVFTDLLEATQEAERSASVLIIDSISHFWKEVQDAYKKRKGRDRLEFQDWGPIKDQWQRFTDSYLSAKVHIILSGRAADVYEYSLDEYGKKQLEKTGTKMQVEKNLGYEPSLAVEMELVSTGDFKKGERAFLNRAYILKDRYDRINGKVFDDPTFDTFLPHIEMLNLGGEHRSVDTSRDSQVLFSGGPEDVAERRRRREILLEEIQGELVAAWPGSTTQEKHWKNELVFEAFKTRSWTAVGESRIEDLEVGLKYIRRRIVEVKGSESAAVGGDGKTPAPVEPAAPMEAPADRLITNAEWEALKAEAKKHKVSPPTLNTYLANAFLYLVTGEGQFDSAKLKHSDLLKTAAWIKSK